MCRSVKNSFLAVFTPAALKAAGNKSNESNQSNYSETGRAAIPKARPLKYSGYTLLELLSRLQPNFVPFGSAGSADQ